MQRRDLLRKAFSDFDPDTVAVYTDEDIDRILAIEGMIRNKRKIQAVITNAAATVALRGSEHGDLSEVVWSFVPTYHTPPARLADIPKTSAESTLMAEKLKELGFSFVGPTTCYALMQAIGLVNDRVEIK